MSEEQEHVSPPMTVKIFKDRFDFQLEEKVIKESFNQAHLVAQKFIQQVTTKECRNQSIQTDSLDSYFAAHKLMVEKLQTKIQGGKIQYQSIFGELNRLLNKLKDAEAEHKRLLIVIDREETKNAMMVDSFMTSEGKIRDLQQQNEQKRRDIAQQSNRIESFSKQ